MSRINKLKINGQEYTIEGKSAYEVAVDNGFEGTEEEWLESLKGDKGEPGASSDGYIETLSTNLQAASMTIYRKTIPAGESFSFFAHNFVNINSFTFYLDTTKGPVAIVPTTLVADASNGVWAHVETQAEETTLRLYANISPDIGDGAMTCDVSVYKNESGNLHNRVTTLEREVEAIGKDVQDVKESVMYTPENIYKGEVKAGGYYDGSVWTENSRYKEAILPLGAVKNGDRITWSPDYAYYNGQYCLNAFDKDGNWLCRVYNRFDNTCVVTGVEEEEFSITMRIRTEHDESGLFVAIGEYIEPVNKADVVLSIFGSMTASVLTGKIINCLGDSFTAPAHAWHKHLGDRTGCVCNNYGVASSRVTIDTTSANGVTIESFLNRYQNMDKNADVTIIFGGINDSRSMYVDGYSENITLGDMTSELNNATFYGGLRLLIESIKIYMPGKKIIGVIPPDFEPTVAYGALPSVQEACREIYAFYGIPYADLKKECQEMYEDTYNTATYRQGSANDYHPSEAGHEAISEIIQGTLERVLKV